MPKRHLVIGNGESRSWFTPKRLNTAVTWACNAAYRDGIVDNLVAVDAGMQQEIYKSDYPIENICWFEDWSQLPTEVGENFYLTCTDEISYAGSPHDSDKCVIRGSEVLDEDVNEQVGKLIYQFPDLNEEDLQAKLKKEIGLYVTWMKSEDKVRHIDFPRGWSAGSTAVHLACQNDAEEIYLLGFDLSSYSKPINNVYKGTDNYLSESAKGFNPVNWMNQLKTVFGEFPDTQFYWVDWAYDTPPCYNHSNVGYLTKTELCDTLKII